MPSIERRNQVEHPDLHIKLVTTNWCGGFGRMIINQEYVWDPE
jgi:hypothetical protein